MVIGVSQAATPSGPQSPELQVPETSLARPLEDYESSSLLVLQFEPRGVGIELIEEPGGNSTKFPPLRSDTGLQMIRLFRIPPAGTQYRIVASKPAYRPRSVEIHIRPRQLYAIDLLLASEHDRDRVVFSGPGERGPSTGLKTGLDLFAIWPDGSHRTALVSTLGDDTDPAFSPDGSRVAFSSDFEGDREIYVTELETGQIRRVTYSPGSDHSPAWAPDGRSLVFVSEQTRQPSIWLADLETGEVRRLTRPRVDDRDPCFSPDGEWLVFASHAPPSVAADSSPVEEDFDLAVMELRTGRILPLTDEPGDARGPAWSPDGKTIVYRTERAGRSSLDYVVWTPPKGNDKPLLPIRLLEDRTNTAEYGSPRWSADGQGLVYARTPNAMHPWDATEIRLALVPSSLGADRREFSAEILTLPGRMAGLGWGKLPPDPDLPPKVRLETDQGEIDIQLFLREAPQTVENFLNLVRSGFYDGLKFYRVVEGFVAQAGCPLYNGLGGPGWTVPAEKSSLSHERGAVSMVHGPDPNSTGSQFFICLSDCRFLDGQFTVFGKVAAGMEVLERLRVGTVIHRAVQVEQ